MELIWHVPIKIPFVDIRNGRQLLKDSPQKIATILTSENIFVVRMPSEQYREEDIIILKVIIYFAKKDLQEKCTHTFRSFISILTLFRALSLASTASLLGFSYWKQYLQYWGLGM